MQNFILDLKMNRLEFLDSRFYLTPEGKYVPSVTTILEAYPKDASFYKWLKEVGQDADTIRDEAGRRGSIVHNLTEKYDSGEECFFLDDNGFPQVKLGEWAMFERYVDFSTRFAPKIQMMECNMISDKLGFAGTLDRVITLNGKNILMDIKTSNNMHNSYWLQLSAYAKLLQEEGHNVDGVAILWLNAKTRTNGKKDDIQGIGWQLLTKTMEEMEESWKLFCNTHELWKSINADIKPKQLVYKLMHQK